MSELILINCEAGCGNIDKVAPVPACMKQKKWVCLDCHRLGYRIEAGELTAVPGSKAHTDGEIK